MGAISLAALAPKTTMLFADEPETGAAGKVAAPVLPRLGALFNPYHRADDWSLLGRGQPEGLPLLGAYASDATGSAVTQIVWAKQMGVQFFLASYCPGRGRDGVDALFEAAKFTDYAVGLYIDLADGGGVRARAPRARLLSALEQVTARYLGHPAYLRTDSGRPVLAIAGADGGLVDSALSSTGGSWGPVLRLPADWRLVPDRQSRPDLADAAEVHGLYLGYSARNGSRPASRVIPAHSWRVAALLISPARRPSSGIELPPPETTARAPEVEWVILDSFNNWGVSVPLEPGSSSKTRYLRQVARWSRNQAA